MTRFLLFAAIGLGLYWLWRTQRSLPPPPKQNEPKKTAGSSPMVPCAHCGLHIPLGDAVIGNKSVYCSAEHRQLSEPSV